MMSENAIEVLRTEDGSATLYIDALKETYHSKHGALSESLHVYIRNGLDLISKEKDTICILEVGFGTGLNALLTLQHRKPNTTIYYFTLEPYPLEPSLIESYYSVFHDKPDALDLLPTLLEEDNTQLRKITEGFYFKMIAKKLQDINQSDIEIPNIESGVDLIYYDAFAPSKQAEMWDFETLSIASELMNNNALLTTYCAQGQFKRNLKALGLQLEAPKGAHGKREMTLAYKRIIKN